MGQHKATVGLCLPNVTNIRDVLTEIRENEFGYLCTNIVQPNKLEAQLSEGISAPPREAFSWLDVSISTQEWRRGIVGILSDLNQELQSGDRRRWKKACELINQQTSYALHLTLPAVIIDLSNATDFVNLANIINTKLNSSVKSSTAYWIKVPIGIHPGREGGDAFENRHPWNIWNDFRTLCEFHKDVVPVLELQSDLPSAQEVDRWIGEPVKAVFISTDTFLTNAEGFPCLSKAHQRLVKKFIRLKAQIVLQANHFSSNLKAHSRYIDFLHNSAKERLAHVPYDVDTYAVGYEDLLQIPLQPLRDHLESGTYEVFEKDPAKYEMYEEAIYRAVLDRQDADAESKLVIMVVGAGRGPLVVRSLAAASKAKRKAHVYAVEKNENAANTLFHNKARFWGNSVTVVCADMREYNPPEKADIIVSELLGSLGDNELSPECLDGAQRFLKPDGVMVPQNYTSFVAPCMSLKYYQDIAGFSDTSKPKFSSFETPYIVHMCNVYNISPPQKLFYFEHPNYESNHSNERVKTLKFDVPQDCILNGFSGYFESYLYGNVLMSIHPKTHSEGMFSWFPHFLPLREPVKLQKGDVITATFWRKASRTGVWYEWTITSPRALGIHNANGRSISGVMEL